MIPGIRLVMLGMQGAGKGTQCARLARHYVVPHISTGDMFRTAVAADTEWGRKLNEYMQAGELVPDDVVIGVVNERLSQDDTLTRGFILDGFPRTVEQAEVLETITSPENIDLAIDLDLPEDVALVRLAGRRVCRKCGTNYGIDAPPTRAGVCDLCGGELYQRADDTVDGIRRRLDLYTEQTAPLIEWYMTRDKLVIVDAIGSPDSVTARLIGAIDRRRARVK